MDLKQQYETLMRQELRSLGCNKQLTDEQLEKEIREIALLPLKLKVMNFHYFQIFLLGDSSPIYTETEAGY